MKPPPRFLFAESVDGRRQFVIHTGSPAFIGELFDEPQLDGLVVSLSNGQDLANIEFWLNEGEPPAMLPTLVKQIDAALGEYDRRLGTEEGE